MCVEIEMTEEGATSVPMPSNEVKYYLVIQYRD